MISSASTTSSPQDRFDPGERSSNPIPQAENLDRRGTLRIWSQHLLGFVLPVTTLAFVGTGPHSWQVALAFQLPLILSVFADLKSGPERRQPTDDLPSAPFDAVLYALVVLQLVNVVLFARLASLSGFWSVDTLVGGVLVGINSGYSAIVVAHELIHRRERHFQLLGRLLMSTVVYEHFTVEHVRGHHVRVGTAADPATARFGESYEQFWRRTVPGQFRSAWRLETKRLGDEQMPVLDRRQLGNRVLHGMVAESGLALILLLIFGPAGLAAHLWQALSAVRALEAVNYFEHWGLVRTDRKVRPIDSWDTESAFTLYTLVGLSRHADHHAYASRPYQQLRHWEESPKLPSGYFGMVMLSAGANRRFQRLMTSRLRRRQLGPFSQAAEALVASAA